MTAKPQTGMLCYRKKKKILEGFVDEKHTILKRREKNDESPWIITVADLECQIYQEAFHSVGWVSI